MILGEELRVPREAGAQEQEAFAERRTVADAGGNPHTEEHATVLPAEALAAVAKISAPAGMNNLPGAATDVFVGRKHSLAAIENVLTAGGGVITQATAVHGLGGVGKTSLALHYARTRARQGDYPLVWWITAETEEQIDSAFADLAVLLHPGWAITATPKEQSYWALAWLHEHPGWLLIYDNAEDPIHVNPYVGKLFGRGHQLVTSRRATGWHKGTELVPLDVLTPRTAANLLCKVALPGRAADPTELRHATELAADLGRLPLALSQAGAYLRETGTSFAAYRTLLSTTPDAALDTAADGTDTTRTIARIWQTTLGAIRRRDPFAVDLLHVLAWYAPEALPRAVLVPLADHGHDVHAALKLLADYNMISLGPQTVTVHRLVQTVLRGAGPESDGRGHADAERAMAQALPAEAPSDVEAQPDVEAQRLLQSLLPHIQSLAAGPSGNPDADVIAMYRRAADELVARDQRMLAIPLLDAVVDGQTELLGIDHPDTLDSRDFLAELHSKAGEPAKAVSLCNDVFLDRMRVFGGDAPSTLASRDRLAYAHRKAGRHSRSVREFEAVVADRARVLGPDHQDTLSSRNGLAYALQLAGEHRRAVREYEAVVADCTRVLDADHPDTLSSRNGLAYAHRVAGDHRLAIELYGQAVADRARVLGPDHPDTLTSRG
ncbi:FxSxx-COOH system tetratricopeptide repeat protein [Streptomyces sp. NBC_01210]|uniref:FxSxx-COOH system tetratricopeptide repeat protein n=1 Tax=Streptomyces sp. NBC_01210 TaxID=2903774 RepID=UPI002E0F82F4|nr:FxSxx-COOH system tetratricopeptide repeat protein [Streptomyces sp. NBC_01210]